MHDFCGLGCVGKSGQSNTKVWKWFVLENDRLFIGRVKIVLQLGSVVTQFFYNGQIFELNHQNRVTFLKACCDFDGRKVCKFF